ncbi:hypothetical protein [Mycobacterium paraseoulense]|uniref:DUF2399 domain-containing protein n=1 Tax=Mycobacterium paraseoulense TaxID=590652 RepID=A0A1X0I9J5_9MYCO|nr:hypothetical protein [Mycobacterium paraseoulense]MCV7394374.1 hypothetical protein [Mycobacterium paraseoulense]ORB40261.1 hypothetical protein BST39_14320 [Mycobacterium paraseoulense]
MKRQRLDWKADVLPVAKEIVESYDTAVTLRQLFYRLVSLKEGERGRIPNSHSMYCALAHNTAQARYEGRFPDLIDQGRKITVPACWDSPRDAVEAVRDRYRRDRTEGQPYQIFLGTEKTGMVNLLSNWFADMGLPIIALSGQCSKPYVDKITRRVRADGRPAVLLYAGDHDPTGWSILQNFVDRTGCWMNHELPQWDTSTMPEHLGRKRGHARAWSVIPNFDRYRKYRVALTPEQCIEYDLARNAAKAKDPNLNNFLANFEHTLTDDEVDDGLGVQVEVDALEPPLLRQLYTDAIDKYWDADAYADALAQEESDIDALEQVLNKIGEPA